MYWLKHVTYMWHFRGILVIGINMAKRCLMPHDADGAINDTIAFLMLRWLFRCIIWLYYASASTSAGISVMSHWQCYWHLVMLMVNGIKWPKESCCNSLQSSWPKECNGDIDDTNQHHKMPIQVLRNSFGVINNAISIMSYWCQYKGHHMTREVMLYLISVVLN